MSKIVDAIVKSLTTGICCICLSIAALSQSAPTPDTTGALTLDSCVGYALKHEPLINMAIVNVAIVDATNRIATSGWLPQVNATGTFTHYNTLPTAFFNSNGTTTTQKSGVINTATPGLIGYAMADRAAAVQLWEPAYTTLLSKKSEMRTIDIGIAESWKKFTGSRNIPYLGVAAHVDWAEKHRDLIPKLYAAYQEAAEWVTAHPDEASKLIAPKGTPDDQKAIAELIRANDRLGMNVKWASDVAKEINSVYAAGKSIAFLPSDPATSTIYRAPGK